MTVDENIIQDKIYTIRGVQVMIDRDLAQLYGIETKRVNEAVKNNPDKFPNDFMFELTDDEFSILRSKISTTNFSKVRVAPKVFTEQGVYMLATIIKSEIATCATISIMRTFTKMKKFLMQNASVFQRLANAEHRLFEHDKNFDKLFKALEDKKLKPIQGIFYNGQIFDAYIFVNDLLKSAKQEVILVDNYIDDTTLTLFSKYPNIKFRIIAKSISKKLKLDVNKYNAQYNNLEIEISSIFHDRFLILDNNEAYHIGASLKDLGKKVFGFSKIDVKLLDGLINAK